MIHKLVKHDFILANMTQTEKDHLANPESPGITKMIYFTFMALNLKMNQSHHCKCSKAQPRRVELRENFFT